ncbi:hypothetical protein N8083_01675 [Candidatus Pacebacteria bacterium]|nr:hypothetical protein [Candidatus Paceibacterota bacterium]
MGYRSAIQIVLIIISIVIIVTYVQPTFEEVRSTQDETKEFQEALVSAKTFNTELQKLTAAASSFNEADLRALERYIPDTVDTIAVMRDIETIIQNNKMALTSLGSEASGLESAEQISNAQGQTPSVNTQELYVQQFEVSVAGTYDQFKLLLQDFERNAYPLEVQHITFSSGEGSLYNFDITLETYSFISKTEVE